jgi:hypothetical protein
MIFIFITYRPTTSRLMMILLIVGSHSLNTLPAQLQRQGITRIIHWDGYKTRHLTAPIPREVGAIVLLTDAVAHDVVQAVRRRAQRRGLRLVYARRSRASIERTLKILLGDIPPEHCRLGAGQGLRPLTSVLRRMYGSMVLRHGSRILGFPCAL